MSNEVPQFSPSEETRRADPSDETLKIWASGAFANEQAASLAQQVLDARATLEERTRELEARADFMERRGYRRCDAMACNCNGWHGGHSAQRLTEIGNALEAAGRETNGVTILGAVKAALTDLEAAEATLTAAQAELCAARPSSSFGYCPTCSHLFDSCKHCAREAAEATTRWQPIETAPKDGTSLLLAVAIGPCGQRSIGQWFQGYPDRGWWVSHAIPVEPTHWMPLLALPEAALTASPAAQKE